MPPLAIAAALASALIHASWNAALKGGGGKQPIALPILSSLRWAALGLGLIIIAWSRRAPPAAWPYTRHSTVDSPLSTGLPCSRGYDAGDMSHVYTLARGSAPLLVALGAAADRAGNSRRRSKLLGIALVSLGVLAVGASPRAPLKRDALGAGDWACASPSYSLVDALGARVTGNACIYPGLAMALTVAPMVAFALWRRGLSAC